MPNTEEIFHHHTFPLLEREQLLRYGFVGLNPQRQRCALVIELKNSSTSIILAVLDCWIQYRVYATSTTIGNIFTMNIRRSAVVEQQQQAVCRRRSGSGSAPT